MTARQVGDDRVPQEVVDEYVGGVGRLDAKLWDRVGIAHGEGVETDKGEVMVISRSEVTAVRLTKQDTGLITKPTLVWKLTADKGGPHDAQVTYQTDGLTWRADYNIVINKDDTGARRIILLTSEFPPGKVHLLPLDAPVDAGVGRGRSGATCGGM